VSEGNVREILAKSKIKIRSQSSFPMIKVLDVTGEIYSG
jgi:hypothetical protein